METFTFKHIYILSSPYQTRPSIYAAYNVIALIDSLKSVYLVPKILNKYFEMSFDAPFPTPAIFIQSKFSFMVNAENF